MKTITKKAVTATAWIKELRPIGPCEVNVGYVDRAPFAANAPHVGELLECDPRETVTALRGGDGLDRAGSHRPQPAPRARRPSAVGATFFPTQAPPI